MSGYEGRCPSCGAAVVFQLGSSLLRVCEHCGSAVARKGANLEAYGKVAELIPTPSLLKLGIEGDYEGAPPFRLVGRLQLDYGQGTWDEWLMAFGDETWAWLSESQGRFHYMGQQPLPPVPAFDELSVGQTIDLGNSGVFIVAETRSARFKTAQGELPFDVEPGSLLNYADLSGPKGQMATLDYGTGRTAEALYVGREVALGELGFKDLPDEEARRKKVTGQALKCPNCAGPLELKAPDLTQRVACPYCGSLLDATRDLAVLETLDKVAIKPLIPLGAKGRLNGVEWTLIGFMERSVNVEGVRYPWHEYLLYEPARGFRWLVESSGHWTFVEPVNLTDVRDEWGGTVRHRDVTFKHFQSGRAQVDHVLGEFYWAVASGDQTDTTDYVSPPHMLSKEEDANELHWSFGSYKTPAEIQEAFRLPALPRDPVGVGACQPWPWKEDAKAVYSYTLLFLGVLLVMFFGFAVRGSQQVHAQEFTIPATAVQPAPAVAGQPAAPELAMFSEPFVVSEGGNLQVQIAAPVNNGWLYLDGALINEQTGEVDEFDAEVAYYTGSDSDGAWAEGGTETTRYVGSVRPGRYVLRLGPQFEPGRNPGRFSVRLRSRVPRFLYAFFAALGLLAFPAIVAWKHMRFESRRWAESDHPMFETEE